MTERDDLGQFIDFLSAAQLADFPEKTKRIAAWNILDTMGSIIAGGREPEIVQLSRRFKSANPTEQSTALVDEFPKMNPSGAAFLNGTAGVALEIDPGHRYALGHPSIHVLPAVLAIAESDHRSGADLMLSYLLGYEACARLGISCDAKELFHPHGVFGTVGAAVGCAHLGGARDESLRQAMNIACSFIVTNSWLNTAQGATVRNACAGMAGHFGILSREMAESGFTGIDDGVSETFGRMVGKGFSYETFLEGLGNPFEVDRFYTKMHGCCGLIAPAMDALEEVRGRTGFDPEQVDRVLVRTFYPAANWDTKEPPSPLAARFSLSYAGAVMLVRGECTPENFSHDCMKDPRIRDMARRVEVLEDPALTARLPSERPAEVEVSLRDGTQFKASKSDHRGLFTDPHSETELENKFIRCTESILGEQGSKQVMEKFLDIESVQDVTSLTDMLRNFQKSV